MSRYPSKILLFGEYAIIHHSMALAIPYQGFYGTWKKSTQKHDTNLFADYLDDLEIEDILFDRRLYDLDQSEGYFFTSNIPQGYGVGSSGSLTAAFYERYLIRNREFPIVKLMDIFAQMESYFHGSSSGFDPMISYLNYGLIIGTDKEATVIKKNQRKKYIFYLINSRKSRETAPLVKLYKEKYLQDTFKSGITELIKLNEKAIHAYLNNTEDLKDIFHQISILEYDLFPEMIISSIKRTYQKLNLKLCGAGGGGFYLGITEKVNIPTLIREHDIILIE